MSGRWNGRGGRAGPTTNPAVDGATLTALEWGGNESTTFERRLVWSSPMSIYPATYLFKVFPRKKDTGANPRYYTTFFWGNNGDFTWDTGDSANTYYGAHPYPDPAPNGAGKWEISVRSNDILETAEVEWDRWFNQAFRARNLGGGAFEHEFYWDQAAWQSNPANGFLEHGFNDGTWAVSNPPSPCIMVGQAPNVGGVSWGGYPGFEEFKGRIRGMAFFSAFLTTAQITALLACETDSQFQAVVAAQSLTSSLWYLNMNPTVADVTDKSGNSHHPAWVGADRPADFTLP